MIDLKRVLAAKPKNKPVMQAAKLTTPWGDEVLAAAQAVRAVRAADARTQDVAAPAAPAAPAAQAAPAAYGASQVFAAPAVRDAYPPRAEHPRPQFARSTFRTLNGWWRCAFASLDYDPQQDARAICAHAAALRPEAIDTPILVPFSPEADLSGVGRHLRPGEALWYRGDFPAPALAPGERCLLHFEAVDDTCAVWVNGRLVGTHQGGYLPFAFDITDALAGEERLEDVACTAAQQLAADAVTTANRTEGAAGNVRAETGQTEGAAGSGCQEGSRLAIELVVVDPSDAGIQLRGKQKIDHSDLWYTAQSGIWQPVWLETVPAVYIASARITPDALNGRIRIDAHIAQPGAQAASAPDPAPNPAPNRVSEPAPVRAPASAATPAPVATPAPAAAPTLPVPAETPALTFTATLLDAGAVVARDSVFVTSSQATVVLACPNPHLWSPADPHLYGIELTLGPALNPSTRDQAKNRCRDAVQENQDNADGRGPTQARPDVRGFAQACPNGNGNDLPPVRAMDASRMPGTDTVRSYCALRICEVKRVEDGKMRFHLNGQPFFLKGVLDQGYWPDGLMTAPADAAFVHDILAMQAAGFTMLRKHIKIEAERFYYHCDRLGMIVWQDMVSGGGNYDETRTMYIPTLLKRSWTHYSDRTTAHWRPLGADSERYRRLWTNAVRATIDGLRNHPCIMTWVLFNEGWGQFDAAAATQMARRLDPTRPIESVSGWFDQRTGDYFGVHNYFRDMAVFPDKGGCSALLDPVGAARLGGGDSGAASGAERSHGACRTDEAAGESAGCPAYRPASRPAGRPASRETSATRACVCCEFGGLVHNVAGHAQMPRSFGYEVHDTMAGWRDAVRNLIASMDELELAGLAGYVYTQVSDVEEETNGILTYDRRINKLTGPVPGDGVDADTGAVPMPAPDRGLETVPGRTTIASNVHGAVRACDAPGPRAEDGCDTDEGLAQ